MAIETFVSHSAPFGEAIPATTPHAVSVSLPTLDDVRRVFHDQDPTALAGLQTIYPRFGEHPFIKRALVDFGYIDNEEHSMVVVSSPQAAEQVIDMLPVIATPDAVVYEAGALTFLSWPNQGQKSTDHVKRVMKRLGVAASSRRAEDYLHYRELIDRPFEEIGSGRSDEISVARQLQQMYAPARPDVLLANSGMSAVHATIEALQTVRNPDPATVRDTWVVLGNLYHDTTDLLLDKSPAIKTKVLHDATNTKALQELISSQGSRITAIITEAVTNPLLAVPDLEQVKAIAGDIPLVVDVSTAGSAVVNALPHADVLVESLTKFAGGKGDLMMGAVILNQESDYIFEAREALAKPSVLEPPYIRDVKRLSHELHDWRLRAAKTGKNTLALAGFFEGHPGIQQVAWSGAERSQANFAAIARDALIHAGVITIETKGDLRPIYDVLDLSKGLSFGTEFTLNTAYVHVTHPQEVAEQSYAATLAARTGLTARMLRVSVGTENPDDLIERYAAALEA